MIAGLGVGRGYMNLPDKQRLYSLILTERELIRPVTLTRISPEGEMNFSEELTIRSSFAV